ncbi:uncharacterized protein LOC110824064 [Carica papaya]|uniref:uncharacterized protein LOC110824064 n=1 Tax=Carica papaya TaxID=3649 RepID=UPI000B8D0472|nr:uncharacterized protein LOC110824064 [Carica papaya]
MPVSGNEETGFKPIAWQSSDYSAGIPIKKRRFPLIRPPSPPIEEPSSLLEKNDSQQEKLSNPSQGLPISRAPDVATSVSGLLTTRKSTLVVEETRSSDVNNGNLAPTTENHPRVPIEKLNCTSQSADLTEIEAKEKVVEVKTSASVLINPVTIELKSASTEALAPTVGKEKSSRKEVEEKCQSAISNVSANIKLSLNFKEHLIPAAAGPQSGESCQSQEKEELVSLGLSLSKGESSMQDKIDDLPSNNDGENTCSNRSNWDLNTTMDTWESPDASAGDLKPLNCMAGMVGSAVNTENQNIVGVGCRSDTATLSTTSEASLLLGISSSCHQLRSCEKNPSLAAKVGQDRIGLIIPSLGLSLPSNNVNMVSCRAVKTEPVDKNVRQDSTGATANTVGQETRVKPERIERHNQEAFIPSNHAVLSSIKLEPVSEVRQENLKQIEATPKVIDKQMMRANNLGICSSSMSNQSDEHILQPKDSGSIPPCAKVVHASEKLLNHSECSVSTSGSEDSGKLPQEACETAIQVASEPHTEINRDASMDDADKCSLKSMDELPFGSCVSVEGSVSDEEMINLSGDMLEEESYGSDYDSDGNHNIPECMDIEQDGGEDDYEDGEVRESVSHTVAVDSALEKSRVESINEAEYDNKITEFRGLTNNELTTSSFVKEKVNKVGDHGEMNDDYIKRSGEIGCDKEIYLDANKRACLQKLVEIPNKGPDNENHIAAVERKSLDVSRRKDATKEPETEKSSDPASNAGQGTLATASVASDGKASIDVVEKNQSTLPKAEASSSGDFAGKDSNSGGTRSRIINLARASNASSSITMRSILGGSIQSQSGGERLSNVAFDGEKLHPRGR